MEIKDENYEIIVVLHFLSLTEAYNFIRNFTPKHWAWDHKWKHIYVSHITNECDGEGIVNEFIQFTISREAFDELKKY
jgi:hypothetical protein